MIERASKRPELPPEIRGAAILVFVIFFAFILGYVMGTFATIDTWCAT